MKITQVYNTGFTTYCDAFAVKSYSGIVYFLSLTGPVSAVQSITASLLEGRGVTIYGEGINKVVYPPYKTKFKMISRRLPSKYQHLIFYPEIALPTNNNDNEFLILVKDEAPAPEIFFKYLNRRTDIPMHYTWAEWLWKAFIEEEFIEELYTEGIKAYLCGFNDDYLTGMISNAVKSRRLKVRNPDRDNNKTVQTAEEPVTPKLPEQGDSFSPMRRIQRASTEMPDINERIIPNNRYAR